MKCYQGVMFTVPAGDSDYTTVHQPGGKVEPATVSRRHLPGRWKQSMMDNWNHTHLIAFLPVQWVFFWGGGGYS